MNKDYQIGEVCHLLGLSADTLRYYEKIGLLTGVRRTASGLRRYSQSDVSVLRFIRRAQKMDFSLAQIADLLSMRKNPLQAREDVRRMTADKLEQIEERIEELDILRRELQLLLNLCRADADSCPIIKGLDSDEH